MSPPSSAWVARRNSLWSISPEEQTRVRALRDRFEATLLEKLPHIYINGKRDQRLPNTSNIAFDFVEAEAILLKLDLQGICSSSGSACTTGSLDPSHVLSAMGLTPARARSCVRFSFSHYNTDAEIDYALKIIPPLIEGLRAMSPLNPDHTDNFAYDVEAAREKEEKLMAQTHGRHQRIIRRRFCCPIQGDQSLICQAVCIESTERRKCDNIVRFLLSKK